MCFPTADCMEMHQTVDETQPPDFQLRINPQDGRQAAGLYGKMQKQNSTEPRGGKYINSCILSI